MRVDEGDVLDVMGAVERPWAALSGWCCVQRCVQGDSPGSAPPRSALTSSGRVMSANAGPRADRNDWREPQDSAPAREVGWGNER